ncbi:MAG TPA: hypothetical protein VK530_04180 [Candidatus Acidoferrum sp.]|nr:hypothetical protein [Candidatus Acidoferrum sp.]
MTSTATATPVLPQLGYEFVANAPDFLGIALAPLFLSTLQSASYYIFARENFLYAAPNAERAPGTKPKEIRSKLKDDLFFTKEYALMEPIPREDLAKYANPADLKNSVGLNVQRKLLLGHEMRVRDMATSAAVASASPGVKWNDAGSDPVTDINAARNDVFTSTGLEANLITLPRNVYEALKENAAIKSLIKIDSRDSRWPEMLAALFDVERVAVGRAVVSGQAEGQELLSVQEIWGDSVMVARAVQEQNLKAPTFARTFLWAMPKHERDSSIELSNENGVAVCEYEKDEPPGTTIRANQHTDEHLVAPLLGFHLSDVLL